jgi:hypothetical protein
MGSKAVVAQRVGYGEQKTVGSGKECQRKTDKSADNYGDFKQNSTLLKLFTLVSRKFWSREQT